MGSPFIMPCGTNLVLLFDLAFQRLRYACWGKDARKCCLPFAQYHQCVPLSDEGRIPY